MKKIEGISLNQIIYIISSHLLSIILVIVFFIFVIKRLVNRKKYLLNKNRETDGIDSISSISNINRFIKEADNALSCKHGRRFAFAHFDIDKFKVINDTLGYKAGDNIIKEIGITLSGILKDEHIYGRGEADNFLVLFEYKNNQIELLEMINNISLSIERLIVWDDLNIKPVITTGIYFIRENDSDIRIAIDMARLAKKNIKGRYKSGYAIFNERMRNSLIEEKKIEDEMYDALKNNEFKIFLQPKISLLDGTITGAEALIRWEHPHLGLLSPIKFIPIFEKNGFIIKVDMFVFEQVCINLRKWIDDDSKKVVPISVNVSRVHFLNRKLVNQYKNIMDKYNIPRGLIEIEITESVVFANMNEVFSIMREFKENGFNISMDDFGSGYSSLGVLREIPIDTLKMDKIFLDHIEDSNAQIIAHNVINLAKSLNLNVVSEGVENRMQIDFLRDMGCDMAQGYIFYRPMTVNDYEKLINNENTNKFNLDDFTFG